MGQWETLGTVRYGSRLVDRTAQSPPGCDAGALNTWQPLFWRAPPDARRRPGRCGIWGQMGPVHRQLQGPRQITRRNLGCLARPVQLDDDGSLVIHPQPLCGLRVRRTGRTQQLFHGLLRAAVVGKPRANKIDHLLVLK